MADALTDIARFADLFDILEDGPSVGASSPDSAGPWVAGRQVHDANIVATMLAHGETRLLSANRSDFRRFGPMIEVVEP